MEIEASKNKDNIYLVKLSGDMDLGSSTQLKDLVMKMIKNRIERVILSLEKVDTVNSAGIGALIYISSTLKKLDYPLVVIVPEGRVMQALEVTRLKSYFTIASSLKEALSLAAASGTKTAER